jgi:acyl dehydratase
LKLGEVIVSNALTVTETHVMSFAGLTGDFHPLHTDGTFPAGAPGRRLAHGLLVTSLCNGLLNQNDLFEAFAILSVSYKMMAPVFVGDTIRATSTLVEKRLSKKNNRGIVTYAREVINQDDTVVQRGQTVFMARIADAPPSVRSGERLR